METKRAQTLEALEAFIRSQRALLARTQSDITRLEHLKSDATSRPTHFMENLDDEFKESTFRLSDQCDAQLALPPNIDWTVYEAHDPSALQSLTNNARQKYEQRNKPCLYQRSELSELQKFVKDARRTIVDPVLAIFECMSEPEEEPEKLDPEEARREREREKLRQLKKRKIQTWGGLKLPSAHARGLSGVFIRHDVEDESLEVDVTLEDRRDCTSTPLASAMDLDTPSTSVITASSTSRPTTARPPSISQLPRSRRPSNKAQYQSEKKAKSASIPAKRKAKASAPAEHEPPREAAAATTSKPRGADKPKPESYKQAWSVSEQHLLEQLLDQIPEGEKNRWQKISRAMNGRRTPRQVASRVQKYFEKLKRFGVENG